MDKSGKKKFEVVFDGEKMGVGKILGVGKISHKAVFKNVSASSQAVEKITKAGGKLETQKEQSDEFEEEQEELDEGVISHIAVEIQDFCTTYGRISIYTAKEKYGTVRVYTYFGIHNLHSLLFPRRPYKHPKYPKWLWRLDCFYFSKFFNLFNRIIYPWQMFIYRLSYKRALKKYPLYRKAILACPDQRKLLEGL